ncbi:hypothetical protein HHK36_005434 [Tetracentron sinense]|nr:hypothetical protein HHK36_005434 [Tetracentron sinense]
MAKLVCSWRIFKKVEDIQKMTQLISAVHFSYVPRDANSEARVVAQEGLAWSIRELSATDVSSSSSDSSISWERSPAVQVATMRFFSFYERASRAFQDYPSLSKLIVLFTVSVRSVLGAFLRSVI